MLPKTAPPLHDSGCSTWNESVVKPPSRPPPPTYRPVVHIPGQVLVQPTYSSRTMVGVSREGLPVWPSYAEPNADYTIFLLLLLFFIFLFCHEGC